MECCLIMIRPHLYNILLENQDPTQYQIVSPTSKKNAFYNSINLIAVTIPSTVTSIGEDAFGGFSGLTSIMCNAVTPPTCSYDAFSGVTKSIPVYVLSSSISKYKAATGWKDFTNFKSL